MDYLLDTTSVSDLIEEHPKFQLRLNQIPTGDRVFICPISRGEILYGIERLPVGRRKLELQQKAAGTLGALLCVSIPPDVGDQYARIKHDQKIRGFSLDENDLWIAATAAELGAVIVTRDQDFTRIPTLTVEDWTL